MLDQFNDMGGVSIGFGQAAGLKYASQGFIPTVSQITDVVFKLKDLGTKDMRVWIDKADSNSFPLGSLEAGLGFIDIPRANLIATAHQFPIAIPVTPGKQYVMCMAPWDISKHAYADDYRNLDCSVANPYANGKMGHYQNGVWSNNDAGKGDMVFEIYGIKLGGSLALSVSSFNIQGLQLITASIVLDTKGNLIAGADVDGLNYDINKLQLVDPITLLPATVIQAGSLMPNTVFNKAANGKIQFSQLTDPAGANFTGNGVLASATFKVLPITATFSFDFTLGSTIDCNLASPNGTDILTEVSAGTFDIVN